MNSLSQPATTKELPVKSPIPASVAFADLPAIKSEWMGGIFAGIVTKKDGTHCAVVKLSITHKKTWKQAMAIKDGELPSKAVAALLAANLELEPGWYWICEEYDASYAWNVYSHGYTDILLKSAAGGALAVRLIPITA
jgi:hypothetical protein